MPRKTSEVWIHFHNENQEGKEVFICKYCSRVYRFPNATKMSKHLNKCKKCPFEDMAHFSVEEINHNIDDPPALVEELHGESHDSEENPSSKVVSYIVRPPLSVNPTDSVAKRTTTADPGKAHSSKFMKRDVVESTSCDSKTVDTLLARALFASGCPFSMFEKSYWKEAFHALNNSYQPPDKQTLQVKLLEAEHKKVSNSVLQNLKLASRLILLESGWANVDNSTISLVALTPDPVYVKSISIESGSNKPADSSDIIITAHINDIGKDKVSVTVADCVGETYENLSGHVPNTIVISCASHCLNSFLDIILNANKIVELSFNARNILNLLKKEHIFSALRKKIYDLHLFVDVSQLLLLPNERPVEFAMALNVLFSVKDALQKTIAPLRNAGLCDRDTELKIFDNHYFWTQIEQLLDLIKPVFMSITNLESGKYVLSDVLDIFYKLREHFGSSSKLLSVEELQHLIDELAKIESCILRPIHAAAYLLDPRFRDGDASSDESESCGVDCITSLAEKFNLNPGQILSNFAQFRSSSGPWANKAVWSCTCEPSVWWKGLFGKQPLSPIAVLILSVPPTVALAKRCNDIFMSRNKINFHLNSEEVAKLIDVQCNLCLSSTSNFCTNPELHVKRFFVNDDID